MISILFEYLSPGWVYSTWVIQDTRSSLNLASEKEDVDRNYHKVLALRDRLRRSGVLEKESLETLLVSGVPSFFSSEKITILLQYIQDPLETFVVKTSPPTKIRSRFERIR
jgi:hypothetical protein